MAGQVPFFFTGANAKIKVNGVTLAFATNIQYSVAVKHAAPRVLGMYEAHTLEPLMYEVNGSFTVIRYTKGLKDFVKGTTPPDTSNKGNGIGSWGPDNNGLGKAFDTIGIPFSPEGRADQALNPSKLHQSMMFDIELFQVSQDNEEGMVAKLRDCRITGSDFRIDKKSAAHQTFTFMACYADEDSFNAVFSGLGQQLT
jgi:hypothetical protein